MKSKVSAWEDSLLNPKHASHANQALQNVRLSCCGGTNLLPTLSEQSLNETLDLLRRRHNVEDIKVEIVKRFLRTATNGGVTSCRLCGIQLQQLLILPCGDLLCSQCNGMWGREIAIQTNLLLLAVITFLSDAVNIENITLAAFPNWTCYRKAEECPEEETKSSYIISRLLELIEQTKRINIEMNSIVCRQESPRMLRQLLRPIGRRVPKQMNIFV